MMTQPEIEIRRAWRHLVGGDHDRLVDALLLRYSEPHRYYHTATHIMMVVRHVHDIGAMVGQHPTHELVAAALYHDAIYQPRSDDNEARSAALAVRDLTDTGWGEERCAPVEAMIMATAGHTDSAQSSVGHGTMSQTSILLDADMAILGSEPLAYQAYANRVRAEYFFVDDTQWRTGRSRVLQSFLERPRIFATDYMRDELEHRARANIGAELATLR